MPSNTPLTDAINALTTYSNTVTGASDTTLSDAVATLAAGYGGGGGGVLGFFGGNITALIFNSAYVATDYTDNMQNIYVVLMKNGTTTVTYEHVFSEASGNTRTGAQRHSGSKTQIDTYIAGSNSVALYISQAALSVIVVNAIEATATTATLPLVIGGGYYNGNLESQKSNMTFYGLNIVNANGEYVAQFMPWLDGTTPCVKDLVSGKLYYAAVGTLGYIDKNGITHN